MDILEKVKERIEDKLDFQYHDWDDLIEDGDTTEEEIIEALNKLEINIK